MRRDATAASHHALPTHHLAWAMLAAAGVPWLVYVWWLAPSPYLLDSPELVAAAVTQGISHPPGHPAYAQLAGILTALPAGNLAVRVHLFSALCVVGALALLPLTAVRARIVTRAGDLALVVGSAWTIAAAAALWFQAVRAEVYALHLLTVAAATCWLVPSVRRPVVALSTDEAAATAARLHGVASDGGSSVVPSNAVQGDPTLQRTHREVAIGALLLGTGLLNHHYLLLFALPGLLLWASLRAWPAGAWAFVRVATTGVVAGTVPLLGYCWLWLRGQAQAWPSWSWPNTLEDVWWLMSAKAFQATAGRVQTMDPAAGMQNVVGLWTDQLGAGVAALLLLAGVSSAVVAPRVFVPVALLVACNILTQVLFDFDPLNPDVGGYFMASFWWAALALGWALVALAGQSGGLRTTATRVLAVSLPVLVLLGANPDARPASLAAFWAVDRFADEDLHPLAPDAVVATAYFETAFQAWYTLGVGDLRPDVRHIHRAWRTWPYLDPMLSARHPELAIVLDANGLRGELSMSALQALAQSTDVVWEPDPVLTGLDEVSVRVCGRMVCVLPPGRAPPPDSQEAATIRRQAAAVNPAESHDVQVRRNRLWSAFNRACVLCAAGRPDSCRAEVDAALLLAPHAPELTALAAGRLDACTAMRP